MNIEERSWILSRRMNEGGRGVNEQSDKSRAKGMGR